MTLQDPQADWPTQVRVREVGLRDGLQMCARTVPTAFKTDWIDAAWAAGVREMEVGSMVPAQRLPQLADTPELVRHAKRHAGLTVSVLVPNLKGAERALDSGADTMLLPLSASRAHSLANLRKPPEAVLGEIEAILTLRAQRGVAMGLEVGPSTAFGCTLQGEVAEDEVLRLVAALCALGVDRIGLADTVGHADPRQVARLFAAAQQLAGARLDCAHFHDTRGLGLANVKAALGQGQTRFDACLGGLGGCPHAPGASGNVATEDLVFLMARMGVATGIDLDALLALRARLAQWLPEERLYGHIAQAGWPRTIGTSSTVDCA